MHPFIESNRLHTCEFLSVLMTNIFSPSVLIYGYLQYLSQYFLGINHIRVEIVFSGRMTQMYGVVAWLNHLDLHVSAGDSLPFYIPDPAELGDEFTRATSFS